MMSQSIHIELSERLLTQHQQAFDILAGLLIEENQRTNLTRIIEPQQIRIRHFLDSLAPVEVLDRYAEGNSRFSVIDIGSGAGFPALPLAIVRPDWNIVSVEATGKKVKFQQAVASKLGLKNLTVINGRAESLAHEKTYRQTFDAVVVRAVAELRILAELSLGLLKKGGSTLAFKGPDVQAEIAAAQQTAHCLGGKFTSTYSYTLPGIPDGFSLVEIEKIAPTDPAYPRSYSLIAKKAPQ